MQETRVQLTLGAGAVDGGDDVTMPNGDVVTGYVVTVTVSSGSETLVGSLVVVVEPK